MSTRDSWHIPAKVEIDSKALGWWPVVFVLAFLLTCGGIVVAWKMAK